MDLSMRENWSEWYLKVSFHVCDICGINYIVFFFFSIKLNPEHTVPTLDDNGNVIWESHAICTYLIDKYSNNDSLYPKDLFLRAKVSQRLFFDASVLFPRLRAASYSIFKDKATEISQEKIDAMYDAYDLLESTLLDDFLVGNTVTLADICTMGTITSMDLLYAKLTSDKYPKITAWLERLKKMSFYAKIEKNGEHVAAYKAVIDHLKQANKKVSTH